MRQVGEEVLSECQTFDGSGNVLFQIGDTIQAFTLDELNNRVEETDLTEIIPSNDELGRAYIVQLENNTTPGGSADGFLSGLSTAVDGTFYGRRLTSMLVNETVASLQTVNAFTASTGGSGVASTPGTFDLEVGEYEINIVITHRVGTSDGGNIIFGLYDADASLFAVHSGTNVPILGEVATQQITADAGNIASRLRGYLSVTGSTTTYQIMQKATNSGTNASASLLFGGNPTTMATANVNGAAASNIYTLVEIIRYS